MSEVWLTPQQIAAMLLAGMPTTDRRVRTWAEKKLATIRNRLRGKGIEIALSSLPMEAQLDYYARFAGAAAPDAPKGATSFLPASGGESIRAGLPSPASSLTAAPAGRAIVSFDAGAMPASPGAADAPCAAPGLFMPASPALPETRHHDKTSRQRAEESARKAVLAAIERLMRAAGCSREAAMVTLITQARADGTLAETLRLARDGRGRRSADGLPSVRSLKRWLGRQAAGGDLAPAVRAPDMAVRPWHALAVSLRQRPQGGTTRWVAEQIAAQWRPEWGARPPSYDTVARFFRERFSRFDVLVGRHTGLDLRSHLPYQPRTREGLWPAMECHMDGWRTHFTAPHPVSGEYVTYEVWTAVDYATGYPTEPAIGMTESYEVIAKCLENYIRELGVPLVVQTDNTGSVKNDRFEFDGIASLQHRLGFTIVHPALLAAGKGNSQAQGLVENLHAFYDLESRELATYQGKGMDGLTLKRVRRLTAKMVRAPDARTRALLKAEAERVGKGIVFDSFEEARAWLKAKVEKRRDTPSRGLPKIVDAATGRRRHMTPREMLERFRQQGWRPVALTEAELIDAFRPHLRKTVRRGMVSPYAGDCATSFL